MKPDYKNWVPKGMLISVLVGTAIAVVAFLVVLFAGVLEGKAETIALIILGILSVIGIAYSIFTVNWYTTFSYNGKKQFARRIIEKIAGYIDLSEGQVGLDIGCGSGALTIAAAKKNKTAKIIGLDRWGKEYASFNKPLCESNAEIEGVSDRVEFTKGDACKLQYPDESFDAVMSNYCYHNIPSTDRQAIIFETLRVLKKGGTFAIHDIFTKNKYGDMDKLLIELKAMGYEKVELLDTTNDLFMSKKEANTLCLQGSRLLVGKK